jgi:hypothetical protein
MEINVPEIIKYYRYYQGGAVELPVGKKKKKKKGDGQLGLSQTTSMVTLLMVGDLSLL